MEQAGAENNQQRRTAGGWQSSVGEIAIVMQECYRHRYGDTQIASVGMEQPSRATSVYLDYSNTIFMVTLQETLLVVVRGQVDRSLQALRYVD